MKPVLVALLLAIGASIAGCGPLDFISAPFLVVETILDLDGASSSDAEPPPDTK
jgi:hypothetical protein